MPRSTALAKAPEQAPDLSNRPIDQSMPADPGPLAGKWSLAPNICSDDMRTFLPGREIQATRHDPSRNLAVSNFLFGQLGEVTIRYLGGAEARYSLSGEALTLASLRIAGIEISPRTR